MNKLLIFPLSFMFLLTMFSLVYTGGTYQATTGNYTNQSGITIDDTEREVEISGAGEQTFSMNTVYSILLILTVGIAIAIVAGVRALGSGLSIMSQKMIFISIVFLGLWACLSVVSYDFMFANNIITLFWMTLTTIFIIGVAIHIDGDEE